MTRLLTGHSGCQLSIIDVNGNKCVRKKSFSLDYNIRLMKQCEKQKKFNLQNFHQTKIFQSAIDSNGLYYFDMEYIHGHTLSHFLKTINISKIHSLVDIFSNIVKPEIDYHPSSLFLDKINSLFDIECIKKISSLEKGRSFLCNYDWKIEKSFSCHGDLSLENIIINNDQLYIIDLLDSFADSWIMDIAKILQDLEVFWSFRHDEMTTNLSIRIEVFRINLLTKLAKNGLTYKQYCDCYYIILLNLFRIVPYSKNKETDSFLEVAINKINYKINSLEKDYDNLNRSLRW